MNSILFQSENTLASEEKFALMSFIAREFGLEKFITISGPNLTSIAEFTCKELARLKKKTDLIWIDFSGHSGIDTLPVLGLLELLSKKGIVCIDGETNCSKKVKRIFGDTLYPILEISGFLVLARRNGTRSILSICYQIDLFRRRYFFEKERIKYRCLNRQQPLVAVVILTYNHEQYIAQCLNSVLAQQGDFRMRVIIIDDASPDQTSEVVRKIISGRDDNDNFRIEFYINSENCGVVKNLSTSIGMASGCDYLTFCEGDDFWSSSTRIQEHLNFLTTKPDCVMSFNTIELCSSDGTFRRIYVEQENHSLDIIDGNCLASFNVIGNFSACFYDGALLKILPENLFEMYTVDWFFNLYCSQFGGIGHLQKPLSVYRQHDGGEWSNRKEWDKAVTLIRLNNEYNKFLDYQYNEGFHKYKKTLYNWTFGNYAEKSEKFDLIIMDDVFPSEISGFRYTEFTSYLREFPSAIALVSGATLPFIGEGTLSELIRKYQLRFPELGNQVMPSAGPFPLKLGKLLYVNFLSNAYAIFPIAEEARVPFAFTLYPGGGFGLNNPECDRKLKRVFDSPCFMKVIVTQQITYDYLITKKLCSPEKISFIFGVVMPQDSFVDSIPKVKIRWGFGKKQLDICFMAHRYTPHGNDKGYDVFINAACRLRKMYDDIYYHIVGPYDRKVLDVNPIHDRVLFHGTLHPEQLDDFFKDMDIIMSPNISGKIWPGSFDGFPTASSTEGGLRGVAIFCTDEFNSASGNFVDGQDFVLINYDVNHIIDKVKHYHLNHSELKMVGESGSQKILDLYNYESQIEPRVQILRELIDMPFVFNLAKLRSIENCLTESANNLFDVVMSPIPSPLWAWLRKHCPEAFKNIYRKFFKRYDRV